MESYGNSTVFSGALKLFADSKVVSGKIVCRCNETRLITTSLREHGAEKISCGKDIQWLLANHPAASALDIHLFSLGWDRRASASQRILAEVEREVR